MMLTDYFQRPGAESKAHFAKRIGVHKSKISQLTSGKVAVPPYLVLRIAQATGYLVTPHELRPDLYPHALDGMREDTL